MSTVEGALLWEPSAEVRRNARITDYMERRGFGDYHDLWRWSVSDIDGFWGSVWDYFEVIGDRPGDGKIRECTRMPEVTWFPGTTLNYAENALRHAADRPDATALVFRSEAGGETTMTYRELAARVAEVRAGLKGLGVTRGDRVAAYVPNIPEALVAFLATVSLGAIWSSCSPDFGAPSVIDRFTQIRPKVLIAVDGYAYNGKRYDRRDVVRDIEAAIPSVEATILIAYLDPSAGPLGRRGMTYADLPTPGEELAFERVPFDHPLWILYSSGTTGLPKPIVHGHGGVVLEHLKALAFHQDIGPGDVFFWYTTTGWMMWNYLVGGLLVGSAIVAYDGAATYPETGALWKLAAETGITYFGTGAPYLLACMKADLKPGDEHDLTKIRGVGSTGSPLPPEGFQWVYDAVGRDLMVGSFSGGTDVATGFVGGCPLLPSRAGIIQCRGLGAKVEAFGDDGEPVIGEVGELVVTEPMPSMPIYFWGDEDGRRYRESYFGMYPGVWRHGDWIKILPDGGCVIYGRSDSTLNRGGVRMGTSEFYRVVEAFDEVADSMVIDTGRLGSEGRLLLYVQLTPGATLDDDLIARIRTGLRGTLSPRHVPDEIRVVPGIPRTLSGKKLEVPVRKILLGTPIEKAANPDAMANPEVLAHFTP